MQRRGSTTLSLGYLLVLLVSLVVLVECEPLRMHLLGIPHTISGAPGFDQCAYTMKIVNFCKAMKNHVIYHYGVEGAQLEGAILVDTVPRALFEAAYPDVETWSRRWFLHKEDAEDQLMLERIFTAQTAAELKKRIRPGDFVLVTYGNLHQPVVQLFYGQGIVVEMGIGYIPATQFAPYRVFETYSWLHNSLGLMDKYNPPEWAVIPAFFDTQRFPFSSTHDGYFLYVGRVIERKGIYIAAQVTKFIGARLLVMGGGPCQLLIEDGYDNVECLGIVGFEERNRIMSKAKALFYPTIYTEPGGCAAVEAMLTGTPVISTDHGAFTETVVHGVTGFRCRTFQDFVESALMIDQIDRAACRSWAKSRYSLKKARQRYTKYFRDLQRFVNPPAVVPGLEFLGALPGWHNITESKADYLTWKTLRPVPPPAHDL